MKSAGKLVPVSANKINELKPIIIPVPTLIPNPNMSIMVNKFLASLGVTMAIPVTTARPTVYTKLATKLATARPTATATARPTAPATDPPTAVTKALTHILHLEIVMSIP